MTSESPRASADMRSPADSGAATDEPLDEAALLAEIDRELAEEDARRRRAPARTVGWVLLVGGLLGVLASFELTMGMISRLRDPDQALSCDINPFIGCSRFLGSWQGSLFGPPNPVIGLMGFTVMAVIGALWASGASLPRWMRHATLGGMVFAFAFITFLQISALFVLKGLCPWCLVAWTVTGPMFFATLARHVESGDLPGPRVLRHWVIITALWYLVIIVAIALVFRMEWLSMAGLV